MAANVLGTGVALRAATDDEAQAVETARRGGPFVLGPGRSYALTLPDLPPDPGDVLVVSHAFVALDDGERWTNMEHHGVAVPSARDATLELLRLAEETVEDLIDLLADLRIAGLGVSRWALMSAPRTIELAPDLAARLAPLRRG